MMRSMFSFVVYLLLSFDTSRAQYDGGIIPSVELTPIRGHYKVLEAINPKPLPDYAVLDKLSFPYDEKFAAKVLIEKPYYLKSTIVSDFKIPDPPANSSLQTRAELDYLLALQEYRSPEDIRSSLYLSNHFLTPSDMGQLIGYWVNPEKLLLTDSLFSNIATDANFFLWSLKFKYERVRPYMLEPKIHDLEESRAASYPGGHVTYAYIYAYIYEILAPEFTDYFTKDAYAMAHAREIMGVHYPSDSEASRIFARQFVNMLLQNPKFLADFQRVKVEWETKKESGILQLTRRGYNQ
jgi:acid phosphatase (class A)